MTKSPVLGRRAAMRLLSSIALGGTGLFVAGCPSRPIASAQRAALRVGRGGARRCRRRLSTALPRRPRDGACIGTYADPVTVAVPGARQRPQHGLARRHPLLPTHRAALRHRRGLRSQPGTIRAGPAPRHVGRRPRRQQGRQGPLHGQDHRHRHPDNHDPPPGEPVNSQSHYLQRHLSPSRHRLAHLGHPKVIPNVFRTSGDCQTPLTGDSVA